MPDERSGGRPPSGEAPGSIEADELLEREFEARKHGKPPTDPLVELAQGVRRADTGGHFDAMLGMLPPGDRKSLEPRLAGIIVGYQHEARLDQAAPGETDRLKKQWQSGIDNAVKMRETLADLGCEDFAFGALATYLDCFERYCLAVLEEFKVPSGRGMNLYRKYRGKPEWGLALELCGLYLASAKKPSRIRFNTFCDHGHHLVFGRGLPHRDDDSTKSRPGRPKQRMPQFVRDAYALMRKARPINRRIAELTQEKIALHDDRSETAQRRLAEIKRRLKAEEGKLDEAWSELTKEPDKKNKRTRGRLRRVIF